MTAINFTKGLSETSGLWNRLQQPISIAPLIIFRVLFGLMLLASLVRFWLKGWITELYLKPAFFFTYQGFEWVRPLGYTGMHLLFAGMVVAALLITLGWFYRAACSLFFAAFTYVELIDSTNYLNHYYFISLISFLLIWLPANRYFSLDVRFSITRQIISVPLWVVGIIRLQVGLVYFFAGIAKLHPDWLLEALPMKIWLPAKSHLFLIGPLMYQSWVAYLFSWFGALYDLCIVFFLLNRKTRPVAYFFVVVFHLATALFFPGIGVFPYVMIGVSLVFLSSDFQHWLLESVNSLGGIKKEGSSSFRAATYHPVAKHFWLGLLGIYFFFQILIPFRYVLYPGPLFWSEEGFRFSWRVMLMEKSGNVFFYVKEPATGKTYEVNNREHLTALQEKMMSTQPDMLLRFAHYLAETYTRRGVKEPAVYAECYVALNGRRSRLFIDPNVNLARQSLSWTHYTWVLPFQKSE